MSKRKAIRNHISLLFQFVVSISILIYTFSLFKFQSHPNPKLSPVTVFEEDVFTGKAKIAFLFLARAGLPLDFIWHVFFEGGGVDLFSIYIHSKPGFVFDASSTRSHFFFGRQLDDSIEVSWGQASMIEAERLLMQEALQDPANQRFVLLSESCVPLYNFSYTYNYLVSSSKSFVDSFLDKKDKRECRYNPKMSPIIPKNKWRKGSQWITLVRMHARFIVEDNLVFPIFKKHCKRAVTRKQHNCIPDEHYVQTLLSMIELENEVERRTLTYAFWNHTKTGRGKESWHPSTFMYDDASPNRIKGIKEISHVKYETELRTEWCLVNSTTAPCYLFARKFSRGAATRLLTDSVLCHIGVVTQFYMKVN